MNQSKQLKQVTGMVHWVFYMHLYDYCCIMSQYSHSKCNCVSVMMKTQANIGTYCRQVWMMYYTYSQDALGLLSSNLTSFSNSLQYYDILNVAIPWHLPISTCTSKQFSCLMNCFYYFPVHPFNITYYNYNLNCN